MATKNKQTFDLIWVRKRCSLSEKGTSGLFLKKRTDGKIPRESLFDFTASGVVEAKEIAKLVRMAFHAGREWEWVAEEGIAYRPVGPIKEHLKSKLRKFF